MTLRSRLRLALRILLNRPSPYRVEPFRAVDGWRFRVADVDGYTFAISWPFASHEKALREVYRFARETGVTVAPHVRLADASREAA